jgi:hypothetical protein
VFVAMRDIEPNEQICVDYAMCLAGNSKSTMVFEMSCKCGFKKCRGVVREDDWMLPILQKRYRGYFSWYVQEKIDRLKKLRKKSM